MSRKKKKPLQWRDVSSILTERGGKTKNTAETFKCVSRSPLHILRWRIHMLIVISLSSLLGLFLLYMYI